MLGSCRCVSPAYADAVPSTGRTARSHSRGSARRARERACRWSTAETLPAVTLGVELATLVIDCADAAPMRIMYSALGAVPDGRYPATDAFVLSGVTISFQEIADYRPPVWPGSDVPTQLHLDFFVDSLDEAQRHLEAFGAKRADVQPHLSNGLVVMLDPAGHPFCIGTRL